MQKNLLDKTGRARTKTMILAIVILLPLFLACIPSAETDTISREIKVHLLNINDMGKSWIYDTEDLKQGVLQAINDANDGSKHRVKLKGEAITYNEITDLNQMEHLLMTSGRDDIIISAGGETWPTLDSFIQNDSGYGGDAPGHLNDPVTITPGTMYPKSYTGQLISWDLCDVYEFGTPEYYYHRFNGLYVEIHLEMSSDSDFDLYLYDSTNQLKASKTTLGVGITETIKKRLYSGPSWKIKVVAKNTENSWGYPRVVDPGNYNLKLKYYWKRKSGCPHVLAWNGTAYSVDNNIIHKGTEMDDDFYILQKSVIPFEDGTYSIAIGEWEQEMSEIDRVKIYAIDHDDLYAAIDDQTIYTFSEFIPLLSAISDNGTNLLPVLATVGDGDFKGQAGDSVILDFGQIENDSVLFTGRFDLKPRRLCINIEIYQHSSGTWQFMDQKNPRDNWAWEATDISNYIPTGNNTILRLTWTEEHKIDTVGLVIGPRNSFDFCEADSIDATHCKLHKTFDVTSTLMNKDNDTVILIPDEIIWMNFTLPPLTRDKRRVMVETYGKYQKVDGYEESTPVQEPESIMTLSFQCLAPWQTQYLNFLRKRCSENGTSFVSTVGYPFYYLSNGSIDYQIGEDGLRTFLQKDIACHYYSEVVGDLFLDFLDGKFTTMYPQLPTTVIADRPLNSLEPLWNTVGYAARDGSNSRSTTALTVNSSNLYPTVPGILTHNGLAEDLGGSQQDSDWYKGYISSALAIEEARSLLNIDINYGGLHLLGHPLITSAGVYQIPGYWGSGTLIRNGTYWDYIDVDLAIVTEGYFEKWQYVFDVYYLSLADCHLWGQENVVEFEIDPYRSGITIGRDRNRELNDKWVWYGVGGVTTLASTLLGRTLGIPVPLGMLLGRIPLVKAYYDPTDDQTVGAEAYTNGHDIGNTGELNLGVHVTFVTVRFFGTLGSGDVDYSLTVDQKAWIGMDYLLDLNPANPWFVPCNITSTVTMTIHW